VSKKEIALGLAVKTFERVADDIHRDHGDWVIELAKKYEAYLGEDSGKRFKLVMDPHPQGDHRPQLPRLQVLHLESPSDDQGELDRGRSHHDQEPVQHHRLSGNDRARKMFN
jgi:hypothetical protein